MRTVVPIAAALLLSACVRTSAPSSPSQQPAAEPPVTAVTSSAAWVQPLDRAAERVTKKRFGTKVSPQDSPVQPERFSGYHTGVDYEAFPEEVEADVPVRAICTGPLLQARSASGYGGLAVQACQLNGQPVTVTYGHLRLSSVTVEAGQQLSAGQEFAVLGTGESAETAGERKHLHLGIHRGSDVNVRGYVASQAELAGWVDPLSTF